MLTLFRYCPQENAAGVFCLDSRAQEAVIALGLYFLESGCQHESNIVPYLLRLAKSLPKAVWIDDGKPNKTDRKPNLINPMRFSNDRTHATHFVSGIPAAERFSFCLNTLLSDVAVSCPEVRDEIIVNQVETLNALTNMIKTCRENNALPPINLCKATVPILLGLGRSMGRYAQNSPPLLCRLFPRPEMPSVKPKEPQHASPNERHQSISQFRSIIPRSLSGGLSCEALDDYKLSSCDESDGGTKQRASLQTYFSIPYDATTYFFSKYGSSFNQFPNMRFYETPEKKAKIQFPIQHLQTIFSIAKKLLTNETLEHLDEQASDIFSLHQIKSYGYKSFSETINLVLVTLMRELLRNQTGECCLAPKIYRPTGLIGSIHFRFADAVHQGCARVCQTIVSHRPNGTAE